MTQHPNPYANSSVTPTRQTGAGIVSSLLNSVRLTIAILAVVYPAGRMVQLVLTYPTLFDPIGGNNAYWLKVHLFGWGILLLFPASYLLVKTAYILQRMR